MKEEGAIEDLGWDNEGDDDQYAELCNCRFSLAYGGKILLNNAALRLVGGAAFLCGAPGVLGPAWCLRAGEGRPGAAAASGQLGGSP